MKWILQHGEHVKYRAATDQPEQWGRVHKEVHILNEHFQFVSVYVVEPEDGSAEVLLGDGEILEQRSAHTQSMPTPTLPAKANEESARDHFSRLSGLYLIA